MYLNTTTQVLRTWVLLKSSQVQQLSTFVLSFCPALVISITSAVLPIIALYPHNNCIDWCSFTSWLYVFFYIPSYWGAITITFSQPGFFLIFVIESFKYVHIFFESAGSEYVAFSFVLGEFYLFTYDHSVELKFWFCQDISL